MLPSGTEAGESSSSGSWRKYLDFSDENEGTATRHNQPTEGESVRNRGMEGLPLSQGPVTPGSIHSVDQDDIWREVEKAGEACSSAPPLGGQQEGGDANPTAAPDLLLHEENEELLRIIGRFSKGELREILGKESKYEESFATRNTEEKTALVNRASQHLEKKKEIIDLIASMYPEKKWEDSRLIREKFFLTRGDRELGLDKLNKIVNDLITKEKGQCRWAHELNHRLENWDWREE